MKHCEAKMSSKGQVTIPAPVREALELKEGDKVDFYLVPGTRHVEIVARNRDIMDLAGCLADLPVNDVLFGADPFADSLLEDDERAKSSTRSEDDAA